MELSSFQLGNMQLVEIKYKINENFISENPELSLEMNAKSTVQRVEGLSQAKVILKLSVFNEENFISVPFFIEVVMQGVFTWKENLSEEKANALLNTNGPAILMGYARPFITQFTSYSGYPPLILPLMDFTKNQVSEDRC